MKSSCSRTDKVLEIFTFSFMVDTLNNDDAVVVETFIADDMNGGRGAFDSRCGLPASHNHSDAHSSMLLRFTLRVKSNAIYPPAE